MAARKNCLIVTVINPRLLLLLLLAPLKKWPLSRPPRSALSATLSLSLFPSTSSGFLVELDRYAAAAACPLPSPQFLPYFSATHPCGHAFLERQFSILSVFNRGAGRGGAGRGGAEFNDCVSLPPPCTHRSSSKVP